MCFSQTDTFKCEGISDIDKASCWMEKFSIHLFFQFIYSLITELHKTSLFAYLFIQMKVGQSVIKSSSLYQVDENSSETFYIQY